MRDYQPPIAARVSVKDLKQLIRTGEGTYLEFKRIISTPEKIAREISAFANTKGGTLLIGVDDDKSMIGVESYHEQEFQLEQAARDLCHPPIEYTLEVLPFGNREILIVQVKESEEKPVVMTSESGKKKVFVRINDQSIRASKEAIKVMKNRNSSEGVTFEYGQKEQKLFRYLNEYEKITVNEFSKLVDISYRQASQTLVNLVSAGILSLFNTGNYDYFTFASQTNP